ncbi:hypothetical protein [Streptosporangium subroseum]|uniref:hypothetical protein n=1 Tax=Streptosporangium subroseum TaxID=106412 RepID=UPI00117F1B08|nr:hypothetical protein [Streptosporangium subroseum]
MSALGPAPYAVWWIGRERGGPAPYAMWWTGESAVGLGASTALTEAWIGRRSAAGLFHRAPPDSEVYFRYGPSTPILPGAGLPGSDRT